MTEGGKPDGLDSVRGTCRDVREDTCTATPFTVSGTYWGTVEVRNLSFHDPPSVYNLVSFPATFKRVELQLFELVPV